MNNTHIFLCYAKEDAEIVRRLHARLQKDGFNPWLDEHNLLPGEDWDANIRRAIRQSQVFIACLSTRAVNKTGYVQKELREALDAADTIPEGAVFILPVRLNECIVPERLQRWQWVDLFRKPGYARLRSSLILNAGLTPMPAGKARSALPSFEKPSDHLLYRLFVRSGRFLHHRIRRNRYAFSQGHFMVVRRDFPVAFRSLRDQVADYSRIRRDVVSDLIPASAPWRLSANAVVNFRFLELPTSIALFSRTTTICASAEYWKLGLLLTGKPTIYVTGEESPIYFEEDGDVRMILMPLRMSEEERKHLRD